MGTSAQNGGAYAGVLEEYQGWWSRAGEIHEYLLRMPPRILEPMGMDGQHQSLLSRWDALESSDSTDLDEDDLAKLRAWIRDSETLINYIVYERKPPAPPLHRPRSAPGPRISNPSKRRSEFRMTGTGLGSKGGTTLRSASGYSIRQKRRTC